jgi:hypothetical protein
MPKITVPAELAPLAHALVSRDAHREVTDRDKELERRQRKWAQTILNSSPWTGAGPWTFTVPDRRYIEVLFATLEQATDDDDYAQRVAFLKLAAEARGFWG